MLTIRAIYCNILAAELLKHNHVPWEVFTRKSQQDLSRTTVSVIDCYDRNYNEVVAVEMKFICFVNFILQPDYKNTDVVCCSCCYKGVFSVISLLVLLAT